MASPLTRAAPGLPHRDRAPAAATVHATPRRPGCWSGSACGARRTSSVHNPVPTPITFARVLVSVQLIAAGILSAIYAVLWTSTYRSDRGAERAGDPNEWAGVSELLLGALLVICAASIQLIGILCGRPRATAAGGAPAGCDRLAVYPPGTVLDRASPLRRLRRPRSGQGLSQICQQVLDVLDTHREPHQVAGDLERRARDAGVRHPPGVLDQ